MPSIPINGVPSSPVQFHPSENHSTGNNVNATIRFISIALFTGIMLYFIVRIILAALSNRYQRQHTLTILTQPPKLGLDQDEISLLPMFTYRAGKKADQKDLPIECAVCISELVEGEMVRVLPNCKHLFHVKCIDMWLCTNSSCPMCRTPSEPKKVKQGHVSASSPLPQLARCGTMPGRLEFGSGSCLESPSLKSLRRGGSARLGSPCLSAPERDLHEIRLDMSFGRQTFL